MEQFNLEKYLENPSHKVVTRAGRPVRIVCWDSPNKAFPIVGFVDNNPTVFVWDNYGYSRAGHVESKNDLFFADETEELMEFEKELVDLVSGWCDSHIETPEEYINKHLQTLLDLARNEVLQEFRCREELYYKNGFERGREEALKSFPKWEKATEDKDFDRHVLLLEDNRVVIASCVYKDEYYIELNNLITLLKEE